MLEQVDAPRRYGPSDLIASNGDDHTDSSRVADNRTTTLRSKARNQILVQMVVTS